MKIWPVGGWEANWGSKPVAVRLLNDISTRGRLNSGVCNKILMSLGSEILSAISPFESMETAEAALGP